MVFGWLFKKKKKPEEKKPEPTQPLDQRQNSTASTNSSQVTNLSASNKQKQNSNPKNSKGDQGFPDDEYEDQWMYDSLLIYLTSPLWKVPIYTFLDEHCLIFDDEEENKFEYTKIHNDFKKIIEQMIEGTVSDLGISEEQLLGILERGLKHPDHRRIFEQLLIVDNFLVFKKLMVKRNKELELEALGQLQGQDQLTSTPPGQKETKPAKDKKLTKAEIQAQQEMERARLQREQAEIEHAIALSLAIEKERQKMFEAQEDEELQKVLAMSEAEFKKQQELEKKQLEASSRLKKDVPKELPPVEVKKELPKTTEEPFEEKKEPAVIRATLKTKEKPVEEGGLFDMGSTVSPDKKKKAVLPPLGGNSKLDMEPMSLDQLLQQKEAIDGKLDDIKKNDGDKESLEERKKRLQAQKELILAKKKAEREAELKKYEEEKQIPPDKSLEKIMQQIENTLGDNKTEKASTDEEAQKRKNVFNKLKGDLL